MQKINMYLSIWWATGIPNLEKLRDEAEEHQLVLLKDEQQDWNLASIRTWESEKWQFAFLLVPT